MLLGAVGSMRQSEVLAFGAEESPLALDHATAGVEVSPWPFSREPLRVQLDAYALEEKTFSGSAHVAGAMRCAPRVRFRWKLSRSRLKAIQG